MVYSHNKKCRTLRRDRLWLGWLMLCKTMDDYIAYPILIFNIPSKTWGLVATKEAKYRTICRKKCRREKRATLQRKSFRTIWLTFGKCQLDNAWKWLAYTMQAFSSGAQVIVLAKAPCWNFLKRGGNGASQRERGEKRENGVRFSSPPLPHFPSFALAPTLRVTIFLLSPIFHWHKIKDGGYNKANTN